MCLGELNCLRDSIHVQTLRRPCPGDRYPLTRSLISSTATVWKEFVEHAFVKELGKGSLDKKRFAHFMKYVEYINPAPWAHATYRQDYYFHKYHARASACVPRNPSARKYTQRTPQATDSKVNQLCSDNCSDGIGSRHLA